MMNDCADGNTRDLLPEYVHGALSAAERRAVEAHLAACADCASELDLIQAASRAYNPPEIDTARIVRALPGRSPRRPSIFAGRTQRIAAAIGIIAIGGLSAVAIHAFGGRTAVPSPAPVPAAATPLAAATPGPAPTPPSVAHKADTPTRVAEAPVSAGGRRPAMSFGGGLSDLSDDQLDTLLGELDGLDALPSAEPETHLTPILPPADGGHGAR